MMYKGLICVINLLCGILLFSQSSFAQSNHIIFEDQFDDNRNNWLVGDRAKTRAEIRRGQFYFESKRSKHNYTRRTEKGYLRSNQNFEIEIRFRQVKGGDERGYALEWGGNSLDNSFYEFWIRSDQHFTIDFFDGETDQFTDYIDWTFSEHIKIVDFNTLKVTKIDDHLQFLINGTVVYEMKFPPLRGIETGFITPPKAAIEVDYLKISLVDQPPRPILSKKVTANVYAVVVGIKDYKDDLIQDLEFTENDAQAMYDFYINMNGGGIPPENISFLIGTLGTKAGIINALKKMLYKAGENDMVIFYYAGHGITDGESPTESLYLLPQDYETGNFQSAIKYTEVEALFDQCIANKKLWMMDACHSGGSLPQLKGHIYDHLSNIQDKEIAIITSSKLGETSIEIPNISEGKGRGLFSYYLTDGLVTNSFSCDVNQNGIISILELYQYVTQRVSSKAEELYHQQHPQIGGKFNAQLPIGEISY